MSGSDRGGYVPIVKVGLPYVLNKCVKGILGGGTSIVTIHAVPGTCTAMTGRTCPLRTTPIAYMVNKSYLRLGNGFYMQFACLRCIRLCTLLIY